MRRLAVLLSLLLLTALPSAAQWSFGPQIGGFGVGGSVTKKTLFRFVSVSGEFGFAPVGTTSLRLEGVEYDVEPRVIAWTVMASVHPFRSNFAVGAGYVFGGYSADATTPADAMMLTVGGSTYAASDVGPITGMLALRGPAPAFMVGWRGSGFNFGVGMVLFEPEVDLAGTGPMASESGFQADLARETADLTDRLRLRIAGVEGIPLVRLGWELGL